MNLEELLKKQKNQRDSFLKKIIDSKNPKKVIVSGPGTGKTYLFSEILKCKKEKCLVLTFINNLANKLEKDLCEMARCCTFHSFCKSLLHKYKVKGIDKNFIFYPNLTLIIKADARFVLGQDLGFKHCFSKLERKSEELNFFIERGNYYNAVSFDDSVYRMLRHFEENAEDIPVYEQILVDEYQDFNKLEVAFIDMLGTKSPLLIVGDDDQALYAKLKDASADYIRMRYRDNQYEHFELPFCSRCTQVIVDAIDDIIFFAKSVNKLINRVDKKYICFLPVKLQDSEKYPLIIHAHCSVQSEIAPYIAKFIEQEIDKLTTEEVEEANKKADYTVLITGPHHYLEQIYSHLSNGKNWLIEYRKKEDLGSKKASFWDGYKILLNENKFSNLGWRILLECDYRETAKKVLRKVNNGKKRIYDCLSKTFIRKHELVLGLLENMKTNSNLDKQDEKKLESTFEENIDNLRSYFLEDIEEEKPAEMNKDINCLSIILSTYVGCKGISAGHVFAVGLNEGILPKNNKNPKDIEICQFIVILVRTVKKCYLISVTYFGGKPAGVPSVFLDWINQKRIRNEIIDKSYWKK